MHKVYDLVPAMEDSYDQLKDRINGTTLSALIKWTKESADDYYILRQLMIDEKEYFT